MVKINTTYTGSQEEFKEIFLDGIKSKYKINDSGVLISFNRKKWVICRPSTNMSGYHQVSLRIVDKKYNRLIHQLVAIYFLENPMGYKQINHIDCNKQNNHVSNLEWCDAFINMRHAYDNGLIDLRTRKGKFRPIRVGKYFAGILLKEYESESDANQDGYPRMSVHRSAVDGRTCKGFNFKFLD